MQNLSQYANDLLESEYPDWLNIFSVYETVRFNKHNYIWNLFICYENKYGKLIIDNWIWKQLYNNKQSGYIDEGFCKTYSLKEFCTHSYFLNYIYPHLTF